MNRIFVSFGWFGGSVLPPVGRSRMPEIDNKTAFSPDLQMK
jgi:hypothetical protein